MKTRIRQKINYANKSVYLPQGKIKFHNCVKQIKSIEESNDELNGIRILILCLFCFPVDLILIPFGGYWCLLEWGTYSECETLKDAKMVVDFALNKIAENKRAKQLIKQVKHNKRIKEVKIIKYP